MLLTVGLSTSDYRYRGAYFPLRHTYARVYPIRIFMPQGARTFIVLSSAFVSGLMHFLSGLPGMTNIKAASGPTWLSSAA